MTEAQAKRTQRKVWEDVLSSLGGTPQFNDTYYRLIYRLAVASGVSMDCCAAIPLRRLLVKILEQYGDSTGTNAPIYRLQRKLAVAMGAEIECCDTPPPQGLFPDDPI